MNKVDSNEVKSYEDWLEVLALSQYKSNFEGNLFTSMDKIMGVWDDELASILDISKIGHRKRILLSVAGKEDMQNRFGKVESQMDLDDDSREHESVKEEVQPQSSSSTSAAMSSKTDSRARTSTLNRSRKKKAAPQPPTGQPVRKPDDPKKPRKRLPLSQKAPYMAFKLKVSLVRTGRHRCVKLFFF